MDVMREVDVFAEYPVPFEELYEEASVVVLAGARVRVASISHLLLMRIEDVPDD